MSQPIIIGAIICYAILLFAIAWRADRGARSAETNLVAALIYGLSIAVYCTSWTFYGAVGTAQTRGWEYLPIYLGPFLIFSIGRPMLTRIVETGKRIHSTSIADFISAHYGKSRRIAALVTLIAVIGALPYIALQLKSVATTFNYLSHANAPPSTASDFNGIALVALTLAAFSIMFGTRHIDITRHNRGMIAAIAFDSIIKLAALAAVGLFALMIASNTPRTAPIAPVLGADVSIDRFITLTLLSMAAILCLPRQFHVTVVECRNAMSLRTAGVVFLAYLVLIAILVAPIAVAGSGSAALAGVPADLTVLALPLAHGAEALALLVFIGGFAAATGMVIVASVALSTMITNDLLAPFFMRQDANGRTPGALGRRLLSFRRASIFGLLAAAALFAAYAPAGRQLASFGIISFAAVAQFTPALLGALYWRRATHGAAFWSMTAGFMVWLCVLFIPSYLGDAAPLFTQPLSWLEFTGWDALTRGVVISIGVNASLFILLSVYGEKSLSDSETLDVNPIADTQHDNRIRAGDLYLLIQRCLGDEEAIAMIKEFEASRGRTPEPARIAGPALISFADEQISKAIGASSARILLKSVLAGGTLQLDDVATLLGETSGKVSFSQDLLQTTLENIPHGVSVVDGDLNLVAWNAAYLEMYGYPSELLREGRPIADLIRFNAERGECGPGDIDGHITRRLDHLRVGKSHSFERTRPDGSVVLIEGVRSPSGAYVTTFTDVTEYKRIQKALLDSERSIRFYTDNMPAMASFVDTSEKLRFANSAYRTAFNLPEDVIGRAFLKDVLTPQEYASRKVHIDRALDGERTTFDIEMSLDGAAQHMQVTYVPQFKPDGGVRGFFGIYQDVTARRKAEQALARTNETLEERVEKRTRELINLNAALDKARHEAEEATASKTRFLAAASHDVLQPLNAARLFASALKETEVDNPDVRTLSDKVDASIASADRLLRTLLNISKLDAGGIEPEISTFSLDDLFDELANEFSILATEKGVRYDYSKPGVFVRSDRGLLQSALQNIVANAVRYTDEGKINLSADIAGDDVNIVVSDTGRGIPKSRQNDIFQEFKRLERDGDVPGVGLGLAMVDRIVRLLGVTLTLQSEEGKGSRFCLSAPHASAQKAPPAKHTPTDRETLTGLRVWCIDNDEMVMEASEAALSRWGAEVRTFRSDADALAAYNEAATAGAASTPDLLLLDYQLDGERTGFDALAALEAVWGRRPLTIMITASSSGEAEARAATLGIPVLAKPIEPAELRTLIAQLHRTAAE